MIIHTGNRTDIPAFYPEWFINRLREGYVLVRNPYNEHSVTRFTLNPEIVDLIVFCTKNPMPLLPQPEVLKRYKQYWFVTITPYGRDIEPAVPDKGKVLDSFRRLSDEVGPSNTAWRYDPILIDERYTVQSHIDSFERMAHILSGYTGTCIISFIDLYEKVKRNFPEAKAVSAEDEIVLARAFVEIGRKYNIRIKSCAEGEHLAPYGIDTSGCMTEEVYEHAVGAKLRLPVIRNNRSTCACYLTNDIGAYDSCMHLCRYCYANSDKAAVRRNYRNHDPASPMLIGHITLDDVIHEYKGVSWIEAQLELGF